MALGAGALLLVGAGRLLAGGGFGFGLGPEVAPTPGGAASQPFQLRLPAAAHADEQSPLLRRLRWRWLRDEALAAGGRWQALLQDQRVVFDAAWQFAAGKLAVRALRGGSEWYVRTVHYHVQVHEGTRSFYLRIPKNGNNQIRCNINAGQGFKPPGEVLTAEEAEALTCGERCGKKQKAFGLHAGELGHPGYEIDWTFHDWAKHHPERGDPATAISASIYKADMARGHARDWVAAGYTGFTFVRDPVARFISGYTEVEWRYGAEPANEAQRRQGPVFQRRFTHARGTPARFREFVQGLVEGKLQTFSEIFHVKPQAVRMVGPLGGQPMVVGRLEDFPRSWRALQAHLDIPPDARAEFDFSLCRHETSNDPFGTAEAARAALEADPDLQVALCAILLPDFLAYGYALPEACENDAELKALADLSRHWIPTDAVDLA